MAGKSAAISVNVIADAARFKAGLAQAEQAAGSFQNQMTNMSKGVAGALGTAAVINFGKASVAAALEDAEAQTVLARTLKNVTGATAGSIAAVEEYIAKTQAATGVLDDELRPAYSNLVRATKDNSNAQSLLNLALDVSTSTGKSVESVSMALAKAYMGNTTALGKLGIATKDAAGNALSFDQIQQQLNQTFGGATAEAANTAAGQMRIAQAAFADLQEEVGAALIPALTALAEGIKPVLDAFNALPDEVQQLIVVFGLGAVAAKAMHTSLTGMSVAASTASLALAPLAALLLVLNIRATMQGNQQKLLNEYSADYAGYLEDINRAQADTNRGAVIAAAALTWAAGAQQRMNDEKGKTITLAQGELLAFKDLAAQNPAQAKALLENADFTAKLRGEKQAYVNILDEEIAAQVRANAQQAESASLLEEAAEATSELITQWDTLTGRLSSQVAWDNLDTTLDDLKTKAAEAFGGSEQAVKDFNKASYDAWLQIQNVVQALDLPAEVQTRISVLYDQGDIDKILQILAYARFNRELNFEPLAIPGLANGGTVTTAGLTLVGERGPELLSLPRGAQVTPLTGTSGTGTTNITINMPAGANGDDVVRALQDWGRRNGAVPITTTTAIRR